MTAARPPVPYVTAWTGEDRPAEPVVIRGPRGIAYPDEHVQDRDTMGVLWARRPLRRGVGRPRLGYVHPQRQRRAMQRLLCQVCGVPAPEDERGVLWLLEDRRDQVPGWPEGAVTAHPPVCAEHAGKSPAWCPHLRREGVVTVRVRHADIDGVHGMLYRPDGALAVPVKAVTLPYDDPKMPWVLAAHLTRELNGCTVEPEPEEDVQDVCLHLTCKGCMALLQPLGRARMDGDQARVREIKELIRQHPDHL